MKKHQFYFPLLAFTFWVCSGGYLSAQSGALVHDPEFVVGPIVEIPLSGTVVLSEVPDDFNAILKNERVIHAPGTNPEKEAWQKIKDEANRQKELARQNADSHKKNDAQLTAAPTIGTQFFGNSHDGGIPNDNGLSISAGGKVVSVTNSRIHVYSNSGTQASAKSLSAFSTGVAAAGTNSKYDPKTVYDPIADRFVVAYLNGSSSSNSKIVIAFSKTNDPAGAWNIYGLNGNITGSVWSDFVQIGISSSELFITTNLFTNAGASTGSNVYEVELADGYAGTPLTTRNFSSSYFSLHPVSGGLNSYGPHFYMVRTANSGSSSDIYVHKFTNNIAGLGVLLPPATFQLSTGYSSPPDADQLGTTTKLSTGDNRVQSAYFENNRIEFVMNSGYLGNPAIFHGTVIISALDLSFSSALGQSIHYPNLEIGYPGIAYAGSQGTDGTNKSFVSFNYCSPTQFPGCAATYLDGDGSFSDYAVLKVGNGKVTGGGTAARWGDYADLAEKTGSPGEVWVGASFGTSNGYTGTYISQIFTPAPLKIETDFTTAGETMTAYPVPASQFVNFSFPVASAGNFALEILNLEGKIIARPVEDYLRPGIGKVAFNPQALPDGIYFAVVKGENGEVFKEKFIVRK